MNELLVFMGEGNSADDAARKFLTEYPQVWHGWLSPEATMAVASALGLPKPIALASSKVEKGNSSQTSISLDEFKTEREKRLEAEAALAALKEKKEQQLATISTDSQVPLITITQSGTNQRKGIIRGFVRDNVQIAEVLIDGNAVSVGSDGFFEWTGFVPASGKDIIIEAIDTAALMSSKVVRLERGHIRPGGKDNAVQPMKILQAFVDIGRCAELGIVK